jgi:hypothetical protein
LTVLVTAAGAQAAITLEATSTPLSQGGLTQWQINAVGTAGEVLNTFGQFNITPVGTGAGIHNVSQAFTNAGTPTIAQHAAGLWNDAWTPYDSYFKFAGADLALDLGTAMAETSNNSTTGMLGLPTTPGAPMSGYGNLTSGTDSAKVLVPAKAGANVNFMQLVLKTGEQVNLDVEVVGDGGNSRMLFTDFVVGGGGQVTAPVVTDAALGNRIQGAQISHTFATSAGDAPITWGSLTPVAGNPTPNIIPTLSAAGVFTWNSQASPYGSYAWDVTATNAGGNDVGRISVTLIVPEPATIGLVGLMLIGLVGLGARKR